MGKLVTALTSWVAAKAIAAFMFALMMMVLIIGVCTSDVGEISLSWKLYDVQQEEVSNDE